MHPLLSVFGIGLALALAAPSPATAGGRAHVGIHVGGPAVVGHVHVGRWHHHHHGHWGWPHWGVWVSPFYVPYAVPAPVLIEPATPPTWIEKPRAPGDAGATNPPSGYWYWCYEPRGYHPEVKECPGGWHRVPPRAANEGTQ